MVAGYHAAMGFTYNATNGADTCSSSMGRNAIGNSDNGGKHTTSCTTLAILLVILVVTIILTNQLWL